MNTDKKLWDDLPQDGDISKFRMPEDRASSPGRDDEWIVFG
jgi:hypothetical protein